MLNSIFEGDLKDKTIAIWGGAFKPDTDDIRESPAISIINRLLLRGARVKLFDPQAMDNLKVLFGGKIQFCNNKYDVLQKADVLIIATEWSEFKADTLQILNEEMRDKVIIDGRNILDPKQKKLFKFTYFGIGRPNNTNTQNNYDYRVKTTYKSLAS